MMKLIIFLATWTLSGILLLTILGTIHHTSRDTRSAEEWFNDLPKWCAALLVAACVPIAIIYRIYIGVKR